MKKLFVLLLFTLINYITFPQVIWDYPVKPGSDQWNKFTTHSQMVDACKIPIDLLKKMTTEELLSAWENFPLKLDVIAFNTIQQGLEIQKEISDALKLFLTKKNAASVLIKRLKEIRIYEKLIFSKQSSLVSINDYILLNELLTHPEIVSQADDRSDINFIQNEINHRNKLSKITNNLNIYTPRGTFVPNTVRSDGADDPFQPYPFDVSSTDEYFRTTYNQATLISSSTRTYNCHSYAWADGYNNRTWIDQPSNQLYFESNPGDGSYDYVSEIAATHFSYSGDHSAMATSTPNVLISKWGSGPLMRHNKNYCPIGYQSISLYHRQSVDVPQDQPTIISALSAAVPSQTVEVTGYQSLYGNVTVPNGVILKFKSGSSLNFNGYYIIVNGTVDGYENLICTYLKQSGTLKGLFGNIQSAINYASSGQIVELQPRSYFENISLTGKYNVRLYGQGMSSTTLSGSVSVVNSSYIEIANLKINNSVSINNSLQTWITSVNIQSYGGLVNDYFSTSTDFGFSNGTLGGASFGYTSYHGTGDIYYDNISAYDCGVYLTNYSSYNIGTNNTFCSNGVDITATSGAYAYAINNEYSSAYPGCVYGNVFVTGSRGICSESRPENKSIVYYSDDSANKDLLQLANNKYLKLLDDISKDKRNNNYDMKKYLVLFKLLIKEYKEILKASDELNTYNHALNKIRHIYRQIEDNSSFYYYTKNLMNDKKIESYKPFIERFDIEYLVNEGDYRSAIALTNKIISYSSITEDLNCEMKYEKALIYKYNLNDLNQANEIFKEIVDKNPNHILSKFALNELDIKQDNLGKTTGSLVEVPNNYSIANYPNPFNPSTKIKYSLPIDGLVTLKVYDILGNEIATLVNEKKTAGTYEVEFNSNSIALNNLASGIYIYKITAGDFVSSKKMILLK